MAQIGFSGMSTTETRVLVPRQILEKAQAFARNGLYEKALEPLNRNKMEFEIYDTFMKLKMPMPETKQRAYHFKKRA